MHEAGIAKDVVAHIVEHIKEEALVGSVKKISLTVGSLSGIDMEALKFGLEMAMSEMPDELFFGTEIEIEVEKATAHCQYCAAENDFEVIDFPICPKCGNLSKEIKTGTHISINGIELD